MPSVLSSRTTPATTITTTTETLAVNIPATVISLPMASPQQFIIRGMLYITTGTTVTALVVKLRVGQSNTTTAQVGNSITVPAGASGLYAVPFWFIDTNPGNLPTSGYSVTIVQTGAGGNGTVTEVDYEVDYSVP